MSLKSDRLELGFSIVNCAYFLFVCFVCAQVDISSIISGWVFLGLNSTKKELMYLAQGHNAVTPVRLEP